MAMTQAALFFIGGLAVLTTIGLFVNFQDRWTSVIVSFLAAVLWGVFGLSAFDVIVVDSFASVISEPIMPLVVLGFGMAFVVGVFWLFELSQAIGGEAGMTDAEGILNER